MRQVKGIITLLLAVNLFAACDNSEDEELFASSDTGVNVLLIQSDNGKTSLGMMYKGGETYNPPHCYLSKGIWYNDNRPLTQYTMSFGANIKGSDVFDMLNISFVSNQPMSFSNLKKGDTFDTSQFHASAAYTPTWAEYFLRTATALSGSITVMGTKKNGDQSYVVMKLNNLRFNAIDGSCVYAVNGTVEYEIWNLQSEEVV